VISIRFISPVAIVTACLLSVTCVGLVRDRRWRRWAWLVGPIATAVPCSLGWIPLLVDLTLTTFAACLVLATIAGSLANLERMRALGIGWRDHADVVLAALVGGIVGGRIRYLYEQAPAGFFRDDHGRMAAPFDLLARAVDLDAGGLVWYGGVVGAVITVAVVAARKRFRLLPLADALIPGTLAGLAIGRLGCFANGCCYGAPCEQPWAVATLEDATARHPSQLYEALAATAFSLTASWWWRHRRRDGSVLCIGVVQYALWRYIAEAWRGDTVPGSFWGMFPATVAQVTSIDLLIVMVVATIFVAIARRLDPERSMEAHLVPGSVYAFEQRMER
jgi:phosphatidylglycerol---prolipoprotein diacylglyceryl transferase